MNVAERPFLYERVSRRLESQIQERVFRAGDRLPSIRQLCGIERISPASAMQALALLESKGLIEARPKSGYFVRRRLADAAPVPAPCAGRVEPHPVGISDTVTAVFRHAGIPHMVPLGAALPAPSLLPTEKLSREMARAVRGQPSILGEYGIWRGHPELLRQISLRLARLGCAASPDDCVVTVGAMEALNLAVRAVAGPGDVVAVESPCYFGILEVLENIGVKALPIPGTCDEGIDLDLLEAALKRHPVKAALLIPSFNNPNGSCLSDAKRQRLLDLLQTREIPLIEDDIYGDLHFGPERPRPIKAMDTRGQVIYCGSFSKTLSPGVRVGWISAGRHAERVQRLKFAYTLATPAINQLAVARFLASGAMDRHLRSLRAAFQAQVAAMTDAILEEFPEGTAVSQPRGGFFLWVQLPDGVDALELHRRAADAGISIAPGQIFSPRGDIRNRVRISCGHPVDARLQGAVRVLGGLVRDLQREAIRPRAGRRGRQPA